MDKHEEDAILQLVLVARALAGQLSNRDFAYSVKLRIWAQVAEDVVQRNMNNNKKRHTG